MRNVLYLSVFLFSLWPSFANACQCPLTSLSKAECQKYEIIFKGKIKSVTDCNNKLGVAIFEVDELYKGVVTEQFKILFECNTPCAYKLNVGEEWIIYTNYKQVDKGLLDWCSRSRRFIKNEKEDYYTETYGNSYDSEIKFLQDSIGIHRLMKSVPTPEQQRNQLPNTNQTIIILICSILFIFLFYFIFNKFFKS